MKRPRPHATNRGGHWHRLLLAGVLSIAACDDPPLTPEETPFFPIEENRYVRDRFFFYELPDTNWIDQAPTREIAEFYWNTYGLDPGRTENGWFVPGQLIEEISIPFLHVFLDDRSPATAHTRPFSGYAVADMPPGLSPAEMDTLFNQASNSARWPASPIGVNLEDPVFRQRWRMLDENEVGFVRFDHAGRRLILGIFLRDGPLGASHALAIRFDDPRGNSVGNLDYDRAQARLRLLRHPDQEGRFDSYPTSFLMMRHVYSLGWTGLVDVEVRIESQKTDNPSPTIPPNLPRSTYLHMFGLDELDRTNAPNPDGLFDAARSNLWDADGGFLFLPGLRPFSPPDSIVVGRLIRAGVSADSAITLRETLFGSQETVDPSLYTLPSLDPHLPVGHYRILVCPLPVE